jgi:hypothetical protein
MRAGFERVTYGGLLLLLLAPLSVYLLMRGGAAAYANRQENHLTTRRNLLAGVPDMEASGREARRTLDLFRRGVPGETGGTDEFGRWLRDAGRRQGVEVQGLVIGKEGGADAHVPSLRATFRAEQHIGRLIAFLHDLQDDPRVVSFDALRLRQSEPPAAGRFSVDVALQAHIVPAPDAKP